MMRQTALRIICNFYQQAERQDLGEYGKARPPPSEGSPVLPSQHPRARHIQHIVSVWSAIAPAMVYFHCVANEDLSALTEKSSKPPGSTL